MTPNPNFCSSINIYLATMFANICSLSTVALISRIKHPIALQFSLSESSLGLLDAIAFLGGFLGCLAIGGYQLKKPVNATFLMIIFLILSMEVMVITKLTPNFHFLFLSCSRFLAGFFKSFSFMTYFIMNHFFKRFNNPSLIQAWFSLGNIGDIIGVLVPEFFLNTLKMDWSLAMNFTLLLLLLSGIYLKLATQQIIIQDTLSNQTGPSTMIQFIKGYWSSGVNIIHSILFSSSSLASLMVLWLPYFFIEIGYQNSGAFISIAFPLAMIISGFIILPFQIMFENSIGLVYLIALILNLISAFLLINLGQDSEDVPAYIILLFFSSLLSTSFGIFTQTTDQNSLVNSGQELVMANSINKSLGQIVNILQMYLSGILMENNLHTLFWMYLGWILLRTGLHIVRMIKFHESFSS